MNDATPPNRCRIVLIAPPGAGAERLAAAFAGGDVASLILPRNGLDDAAFKALAEKSINIRAITTSEIKISILIDGPYTELAVRTLHSVYGLDKQ